jgi:hypothetical protein
MTSQTMLVTLGVIWWLRRLLFGHLGLALVDQAPLLGMFASAKRRVVTLPNAHPMPSPTCSRLSSQYCLRHSLCRTQCPKIYHLGSFLQSPCSLFPARSPSAAQSSRSKFPTCCPQHLHLGESGRAENLLGRRFVRHEKCFSPHHVLF